MSGYRDSGRQLISSRRAGLEQAQQEPAAPARPSERSQSQLLEKNDRLDLAGCAATAHPNQGVVFSVLDLDCQFL